MTGADPRPHERAWALIAGGGTAGHVLPGLAIGRALVARGHDPSTIHFVGSERGIDRRLVPEAGFPLTVLPGRGVERRISLESARAVIGIVRAVVRALLVVRRLRPAVIVSLGGYASVPCVVAAGVWRVPVVVAEQNSVPGAANRLAGRRAKASAISFPGTPLPRAVLTGNPVRPEVLAIDRRRDRVAARTALGLPIDRTVLLVFGGSQGALRINRAVADALGEWAHRTDLAVRHVIGERDWETFGLRPPSFPAGGLVYQPIRYERDMPTALAAADVALCRAGASTVFELAAVGLPAVLVPLPHATADHQTANARSLVGPGAAVLVPDGELDGARVVREIGAILSDPGRLERMATAAAGFARPDAADRIAALVEEHARHG